MPTPHDRRDSDWFTNRWLSDFNKVHDFRLSAIINGNYLEYLLNELLIQYFPDDHKKRTKESTFNKKMELLKDKEVFTTHVILYNNIIILNEIRNHYAHTIGEDLDELPEKIKEKIRNLTFDFGPIGITENDFKAKFQSSSMATIAHLLSICNSF